MKKLFALVALVLGVVSCQTDPNDLDVVVGGEREVMLTVSLPEATRANSANGFQIADLGSDYDLRYILEVYRAVDEDNILYENCQRQVKRADAATMSFPVRLAPGYNYQIVAWADIVNDGSDADRIYKTDNGLDAIEIISWNAMDETRDAYTGTKYIADFSSASNLSMDLTRPFAKVRVVATDINDITALGLSPKAAKVSYSQDMYTKYNAVTAEASAAQAKSHQYTTFPYEDAVGEKTLFADYVFVPESGTAKFTLEVYDDEAATTRLIKENSFSTDIFVERNKITTIKGDVLTEGGNVSVKVENDLGEKVTISVVDTAEALMEQFEQLEDDDVDEVFIELGGDIDLNDLLSAGILSTRATAYTSALEIPAGKSLVLDLKEHNLVYSTDVQNRAMIHNNGDLTIKSTTGAVKYTYTGANDTTYAVGNYAINNAGTLTIEGNVEAIAGTVGQKFSHAFYAINTSGELIVNSGKILNNTNIAIRQWVGSESKTSAITVNGGEIEGLRGIWVQLPNSNTNLAPKGKITVTGGTITGTAIDGTMDSENILAIYSYSYGNQMKNVEIEISGGTFNGDIALTGGRSGAKVDVEKITITGGVFNGLWGDVYSYAEDALAKDAITIKGGEFSSIAPLVYLNAADEVVKLGKDIENAEPIVFKGEGTLNLNGKSVSAVDDTEKNYQLIDNRGKLAVVGDGTMTVEATINSAWSRYSAVIANNPGGNLTVNGATLEHLGGTDMAYGIDNLTNGKGTYAVTTIENATIKSPYRAVRQFLNGVEATNELYVKAGAKLEGANKSIFFHDPSKNANTGKLVVEEGAELYGDVYLFVTEGSTEWPVEVSIVNSALKNDSEVISANTPAGYEVVNVNGVWTLSYTCAAKIGETEYKSLKAAVEAVKDSETITLARDIIFDENSRQNSGGTWYEGLYYIGNKSFTIDLNGKTISQNGAVNDYLFLFKNDTNTENTINFINGTLDAGTSAYCALCTSTTSTAKITINLENVNLNGNNSDGAVAKIRGGAELNVKSGTVITGKNSYLGIENWNATVNVFEGAEIYMNGTTSYNGCLIGVGGNGVVNVYDGYGKGVSGGLIAMTSGGTINVSGGEWIANTDGTYANSNKSVLVAQSASGAKSVVNVTGGTFKGGYNCYGDAAGDAQINIKGGNFNADPASYVVTGYEAVEENGVYTVGKPQALADFEAAIAKGGEVTLTKDITLLESVVIEGKKVVLDLNGKTVNAPLFSAFEVKSGAELTIKNGKVVAYESTVRAIGGKAIIESGEYTSTGTALDSPATYRYSLDCREGGELVVNGGTFKSNNGMINVGSTVTINGGKFENVVEKTMTRHFAYVSAPLTINDGEFYGKANPSAGGCFFCGAAGTCDIQVNGGKFTSLWTSGSVNRIFESYYGGTIDVTGGMFNTNGGIATFVTENTDEATKAAYPYVAK